MVKRYITDVLAFVGILSTAGGAGGIKILASPPSFVQAGMVVFGIAIIGLYTQDFIKREFQIPLTELRTKIKTMKNHCHSRKYEVDGHIRELHGWTKGHLGHTPTKKSRRRKK